jgi:tryptophan 2,3-dioxygenase
LAPRPDFNRCQFREIEFRLGIKEPNFLDQYEDGSPQRAGLQAASTSRACAKRRRRARAGGFDLGDRSVEAIARAWLEVYRDAERWFDLYDLAEKLVDIDDALAGWRHKHVLTVERIIGNKPGTGGRPGAPYLERPSKSASFPNCGR